MSYAVTDAGEQEMRAEYNILFKLNDDIDQLSSEACDCATLAPEVKTMLDIAWYFTEKAMRDVTGRCTTHSAKGWCACCAHFDELKTKAESIGRRL